MNDAIEWLQDWYLSNCNGDWEHSYGVSIATLDNPGWMLKIELTETSLEERDFTKIEIRRSDQDWIECKKEGDVFLGGCGPKNLIEMIQIFRDWAESTPNA